jgi:phospholipid/cholesterol/gamma-HCH transport system substrate-binding protein
MTMLPSKTMEFGVGLFILAGLLALLFISVKVASNSEFRREPVYTLYATFDNINGLKIHSPVKIGGVTIGKITHITLGSDYRPRVQLAIAQRYSALPANTRLVSSTAGLLGEKYLALVPGFIDAEVPPLKSGDTIEETQSSLVLEELIGQFIYSRKKNL